MDQCVVRDLHTALTIDSLNTSHPIITEATTPDEINALFDAISYEKVSMLHMSHASCVLMYIVNCMPSK